jgi:hypothetical protein
MRGLNLIYTTHFLAPGGSAYLREGAVMYAGRRRDADHTEEKDGDDGGTYDPSCREVIPSTRSTLIPLRSN